jgi:hypothetical protein
MQENIHNEKVIFTLRVLLPDHSSRDILVIDQLLAGLDPRNDLILIGPKIKTKHFLFRNKNNTLTVHNLGEDHDSSLNGFPLEKGKLYLLEKGDSLKVGKIELSVQSSQVEKDQIFHSLSKDMFRPDTDPLTMPLEIQNEEVRETFLVNEDDKEEIKVESKKESNPTNKVTPKTPSLIPYKVYGFIIDVALTYFTLSYLIPSSNLKLQVQSILYPISQYLQYVNPKSYEFIISYLSLIEFMIVFHALMITSALLLGSTPGSLLVGIRQRGKSHFIGHRFKAYFMALLNCVVLPLLVFDIPLYRGKNLKEILTFSTRELNPSLFFKIQRRAVIPGLLIASFWSPFLLPSPHNAPLTLETLPKAKYLDPHTRPFKSSSTLWGVSLLSELNKDVRLLPLFLKKKSGLIYYDLKTHQKIQMLETKRLSNAFAFYQFRYANPFESFWTKETYPLNRKVLKTKSLMGLDISSTHLIKAFEQFGPFFGNALLIKDHFLKPLLPNDSFLCNSFSDNNPVLKITTLSKSNKEHKVFLFTHDSLVEFELKSDGTENFLDSFLATLLSPMLFDEVPSKKDLKNPEILEVLDAFESSDTQTLLTYYINEVKKTLELHDPKWQAFLKKNLLETKEAYKMAFKDGGFYEVHDQAFERSIDGLINKL